MTLKLCRFHTSDRCHGAKTDCGVRLRILRTVIQGSHWKSLLLFFVKLKARFLSHKETRIYSFETPAIPDQPRAFVGLASTVGAAPFQGRDQPCRLPLSGRRHRWAMQSTPVPFLLRSPTWALVFLSSKMRKVSVPWKHCQDDWNFKNEWNIFRGSLTSDKDAIGTEGVIINFLKKGYVKML